MTDTRGPQAFPLFLTDPDGSIAVLVGSPEPARPVAGTVSVGGSLRFGVYGHAKTAGSKKGFAWHAKDGRHGVSVVDDNAKSRGWKDTVGQEARRAYAGPLLTGPVQLTLVFYEVRPKGHFGAGKNAGRLRPDAQAYPLKKPDVLKLARAVEDALTGVVWRDDCQIVDEVLAKRYAAVPGHGDDKARVEVTVLVINDPLLPAPGR